MLIPCTGILSLLFSKTRFGIALRAVADDPLAAQSVGIKLNHIWILVWAVAGFVALVAGLLWGGRLGVGRLVYLFQRVQSLHYLVPMGLAKVRR
ncbi:ABC transporter permease subunit [Acinetobacter brisouii]|uniref:ABC transporter permease subunit n=1 Tax=Acinetobacter brisouii TaxID=396323 RepID=UPI0003A6942E|nr:hypothetical protein [Acinetobacter brisouii]